MKFKNILFGTFILGLTIVTNITAITNVFNQPDTTVTFTPANNSLSNTDLLKIVDGTIIPSSPKVNWGMCTGTSQTNLISITNIKSVFARTILTVLGTSTTSS